MFLEWVSGWMLQITDVGGRFALQLLGVAVASAVTLSTPSAGHVVEQTTTAVTQVVQATASVEPDLMHNGVRLTDMPVMKTIKQVAELNPGPIDDWYPRAGATHLVAEATVGLTKTMQTQQITLPCRGVACTGFEP